MSKGGARPGSGAKKGSKHKRTIERDIALKRYEQRILQELDPLIAAQFDIAKGLNVMMAREYERDKKTGDKKRTGRFVRVDDLFEIENLLNGDGENGEDYYYISTKDPDGKVLENLMSRVFGKAKETVEHDVSKDVKDALTKLASILP